MYTAVLLAHLVIAVVAPPDPTTPISIDDLVGEAGDLFWQSESDTLNKKVCSAAETVKLTCRDQRHYVVSNEPNHEVYRPHIAKIGGAYVGIGSDQGLTFIAWARSEVAWLIDYDPAVVSINHIHRIFLLQADTPAQFVGLWSSSARRRARDLLSTRAGSGLASKKALSQVHQRFRKTVHNALRKILRQPHKDPRHWLQNQGDYDFLRAMFRARRIRIMPGDLLQETTLSGIARVAKELKVPVRIVYLSNAEEWWRYTSSFRRTMAALPVDGDSVVLRTLSAYLKPKGGGKYIDVGYKKTWYRYYIQSFLHFRQQLTEHNVTDVRAMVRRSGCGKKGICVFGQAETKG